jgi:hypothetical protein
VTNGKSVADKLLIRPGASLWLSQPSRAEMIRPLPANVQIKDAPAEAEVAIVFAEDARGLSETMDREADELAQARLLWVAYPKANRADIDRDSLWPILAEYGLRPVSQVSVDDVWSAIRFRPLKEGEAPFTGGR